MVTNYDIYSKWVGRIRRYKDALHCLVTLHYLLATETSGDTRYSLWQSVGSYRRPAVKYRLQSKTSFAVSPCLYVDVSGASACEHPLAIKDV